MDCWVQPFSSIADFRREDLRDHAAVCLEVCQGRGGKQEKASGLSYRYNAKMPSRPKDYRRTEQRNPASKNLDRMTAREIVRLMNREDREVAVAVKRELPAIARAV